MPENSGVGMFGIDSVNSLCKVSIESFDWDTKIQNIINIHIGQLKVISQVFSTDDLPGYIYQNNRYYKGYLVSSDLKKLLRNREYDDSTRVIIERPNHTSTSSISVVEPDVNTTELSRTSIVFKDLDEFFDNIGIIKDEIDKVLNKDNNKELKKTISK